MRHSFIMYEPNQHNAIQGGIEYSIPPWCHLFYFPKLFKKKLILHKELFIFFNLESYFLLVIFHRLSCVFLRGFRNA